VEPDPLDRRIIDELRRDARQSSRSLARTLGVAAGTVSQRIGRLEAAGVIRGYTAVIDEGAIGRAMGFVVGLQMNQGNQMAAALDELASLPEVDEVLVVTGRWDLLVLGRVADPPQLNALLTEGLWQSPSFRHSETLLVIDRRVSREVDSRTPE